MINNPMAPATARQPVLQILLNGTPIPGALSCDVDNNTYFAADKFSANFALYADPKHGIVWWDSQIDNADNFILDCQYGFIQPNGSVSWTSLVVGAVDHVIIEPNKGTVEVTGRDLTSRFIESKTQESFANQTSSQIVTTLAARHNMMTDIDPTTTLVSRFYENDHTHVSADQFQRTTTEWDLITYLAQNEGYDAYVTGTTLHFKKHVDPNSNPWVVQWNPPTAYLPQSSSQPFSNAIDLRLERSATLAKDIEVRVRSWTSEQGRGFTKIAKAVGTKAVNAANSTTQQYVYSFPNLTEDQAQQKANALLSDLTKHERVISWAEPGNTIITTRMLVQLTGLGPFNQTYYIDNIHRSISYEGGFVAHIRAKNSSPQTQTQVG